MGLGGDISGAFSTNVRGCGMIGTNIFTRWWEESVEVIVSEQAVLRSVGRLREHRPFCDLAGE